MAGAETGDRAVAAHAPLVLRELLVSGGHANAAASVDRLRPGIADQIREPRAEAPLQLRRQRIVVGLTEPGYLEHAAKFRPRRAGLDAARRAGIGGIEIVPLFEPPGNRAEVANFKNHAVHQLPLNIEQILNRVRGAPSRIVGQDGRRINLNNDPRRRTPYTIQYL